jgi:hypothetical protein
MSNKSVKRNLNSGHEARMSQQMRNHELDAIANIYPGADKRFQKWVRQHANDEDKMEQMNDILKSSQKMPGETNKSYTKSYIDNLNLFGQVGFHGGSRKKRRSHKKRRSYKKRRSHHKRGGDGEMPDPQPPIAIDPPQPPPQPPQPVPQPPQQP